MPSAKRFCCFPKCTTRCKNGHRGRQIQGAKRKGITPFLYSLLRDYNGDDFAYTNNDELCSLCEIMVRNATRVKDDTRRTFPQKSMYDSAPSPSATSLLSLSDNNMSQTESSSGNNNASESSVPETPLASYATDRSETAIANSPQVSSEVGFDSNISMLASIPDSNNQDLEYELEVSMQSEPNEVIMNSVTSKCDHASGNTQFTIPDLKSLVPTQRKCSFCPMLGRKRIPFSAIFHAYLKTGIFIPQNNRCCKDHLEDGNIKAEVLSKMDMQKESTRMTGNEVSKWLKLMRSEILTNRRILDFENETYGESEFEMLLGLTKANFEFLHATCEGKRSSKNRSTRNALAMLLIKLRLNLSLRIIAFLFNVKNISTVSDSTSAALKSLKAFTESHLGYKHKTREEFMRQHGRKYFTKVLGVDDDAFICILDGTYLYSEKSSNFKIQRKTWSMHKLKNLFKAMVICLPDGYIIDIDGLYFADHGNNDAKILQAMLKRRDSILTAIRAGDAAILDRGFRDVIPDLEAHGIKTYMPCFFDKKNADGTKKLEFTTQEANSNRRVTLLRRLVEQANGRIKNKFHFFEQTIRATHFKKLKSYLRVAVSMLNAFSPPLFTETDFHEKVASQVEEHLDDENLLMTRVINENWATKRAMWLKIDADCCLTFPSLNMSELEELMLGTYQLEIGVRYNNMHLLNSGIYEYFYHKDEPTVLRVRPQSRHAERTQYSVWIEYQESVNTKEGIVGWYCQCKTGSRTLGSCSHICAVLRYLTYDRFLPPKPFKDISDYFIDAASELAAFENSESDNVSEDSDGDSGSDDEANTGDEPDSDSESSNGDAMLPLDDEENLYDDQQEMLEDSEDGELLSV